MNALTNAKANIEDKLFATLDTTTRKYFLNKSTSVLLSDTVGFIRKLPHHLIASFRATLMQTIEADVLLHIIDISNPVHDEHIKTVNTILQELGVFNLPTIFIFNKVDKIISDGLIKQTHAKYPDAIFISAKKKIRLDKLTDRLLSIIKKQLFIKTFSLNYTQTDKLKKIGEIATIVDRTYHNNSIKLKVFVNKRNAEQLERVISGRNYTSVTRDFS